MIQINDIQEITKEDVPKLLNMVSPVLTKRKELYRRLSREATGKDLFYNKTNSKMKIPFEQFITSVAAGYMSGKAPNYNVADNNDDEKNKLVKELLKKDKNDKDYKKKMDILIDYITKYNDDGDEHYRLTTDALGLTSCYEILWEDENNELRYSNLSPLQTVAIYDYSVEKNLIGFFRTYTIQDINEKTQTIVEITDKNGTATYKLNDKLDKAEEIDYKNHNWGDVPGTCYENDMSIFESVVDLIKAFEQLIQNNRNLFEYNDSGCKLKITGYQPRNQMFEEREIEVDGKPTTIRVPNPARLEEDNFVLNTKVFYIPDNTGDISWISKDINDTATQNTIKTYMELITMMSCVPNITDTGFTNADNNSAIKNKYFALSQRLIGLRKGFEKMYLRRWELFFNRINMVNNTDFDFRDIEVDLPVNIPTNEQEEVDNILKLRDLISDETIITKLGYDYISEKAKLDTQAEENFETNMNNVMAFKGENNDNNSEDLPNNDNNNVTNNNNDDSKKEDKEQ